MNKLFDKLGTLLYLFNIWNGLLTGITYKFTNQNKKNIVIFYVKI